MGDRAHASDRPRRERRRGALRIALSLAAAVAPHAAHAAVEVVGAACELATTLPRALAKRGVTGPDLAVRVVIDDARLVVTVGDRGAPPVERVVPRSPSCAADLDLVVLIVERQRGELSIDEGEDLSLPSPPLDLDPHLELGLRGGPEIAGRIRGDLELLGRVELGRFVELMAGARLVLPASVDLSAARPGTIGGWALGGWAGAGIGLDTGSARLFLAGTAGFERTEAAASDDLFQRLDAGAWSAVFGVEARYDRAVWDDLVWLSFGLGGRFRPAPPSFTVEGAETAFAVPDAGLVARIGLWFRPF